MHIAKGVIVFLAPLCLASCLWATAGRMAAASAGTRVATAAALRTMGSRVLVSDTLLATAQARGVLGTTLARVTANGSRTAFLNVNRSGLIHAGGERIAILDKASGAIRNGSGVIGGIRNGRLVEYGAGGQEIVIGEVRGFISSHVGRTGGAGAGLMIRRNAMVEVTELRNGKYLVRFTDGYETWIGADFVALALVAAEADSNVCEDAPGAVVRKSGETIPYLRCTRSEGARILQTATGPIVMDERDVAAAVAGQLAGEALTDAVSLAGGEKVHGVAERVGDIVRVMGEDGPVLVTEASLVVTAGL